LWRQSHAKTPCPISEDHGHPVIDSAPFNFPYWNSKYDAKKRGGPLSERTIKIRLMQVDDFDAVVGIDAKVLKASRPEYYEMKFEKLFNSKDYLPASLVAEGEDGTVVGFVMGELFMGEYGIFQEEATLDTIGVDPQYQHQGIGEQLMNEFMDHLRKVGVRKINTLVDWNDSKLIHFFSANQFSPSKTINLERIL
jgi:ribosomal protein S18 acetylase RimI-like enzyme